MNKRMKRGVLLVLILLSALAGTAVAQEWREDAERAFVYYRAGDYNAAWLFYRRALVRGCDDGLEVYRAAESFRQQELRDDPEFSTALFTAAHFFLSSQYPDDPAVGRAAEFADADAVVNRGYLRRTYGAIGAKAPRPRRPVVEGFGRLVGFFGVRFDELGQFWAVLRTEGLRSGLAWGRERAWSLLFAWLLANALTGIILPVVMALTVAREGRKSYVTAYAFLLHWGIFGIHRFYLGRWVSGLVWLFTGGLLGIGVFFDLFLTGAYVRFWNEDHRDERPRSTSGSRPRSTKIRSPRVKRPRSTKAPKAPKPPKPAKDRPKRSTGRSADTQPAASAAGGLAAGAMMGAAAVSDEDFSDDFGDLPEMDFGEETTSAEAVPDAASTDEFGPDFPEELSDDDFDIGSLE